MKQTLEQQAKAKLEESLNTYKVNEIARILNDITKLEEQIESKKQEIKKVEKTTVLPPSTLSSTTNQNYGVLNGGFGTCCG